MLDDSFKLLAPATEWPWMGIFLILVAAVLSVWVISFTTQRAIRNMANAASKVMSEVRAMPQQAPVAVASEATGTLLTSGLGDVVWMNGGFIMVIARRFPNIEVDDLEDAATRLLSDLVQNCLAIGIEARDIVEGDPVMATPDMGLLTVRIFVRNPAHEAPLLGLALRLGLTEERNTGREEICMEDAHELAGQRAVDDAIESVTTLTQALAVSSENLGMVHAQIETLSLPYEQGRIVKKASVRWSQERSAGAA